MARTLFRLTDRIVRNKNAPGYHADGGRLYLQVSKSGAKSWVYRFTLSGRTRDMGLGSANFVSLSEARAKAAESRALAAKGIDPIETARTERKSQTSANLLAQACDEPTFQEFAEEYIRARADTWRNDKHRLQWRARHADGVTSRDMFPVAEMRVHAA